MTPLTISSATRRQTTNTKGWVHLCLQAGFRGSCPEQIGGDCRKATPFAPPLVRMPPAASPAPAALPMQPRAIVRQATKSLEKAAAKLQSVKKLKLHALRVRPEPSKRAKWILLLLGLDPSRSIWGLKPYDLKWPGRASEKWFHQVLAARELPKRSPYHTRVAALPQVVHNTASHGHHHSGQASAYYEVILAPAHQNACPFLHPPSSLRQVPEARLVWGDFQHEIHPCATRGLNPS